MTFLTHFFNCAKLVFPILAVILACIMGNIIKKKNPSFDNTKFIKIVRIVSGVLLIVWSVFSSVRLFSEFKYTTGEWEDIKEGNLLPYLFQTYILVLEAIFIFPNFKGKNGKTAPLIMVLKIAVPVIFIFIIPLLGLLMNNYSSGSDFAAFTKKLYKILTYIAVSIVVLIVIVCWVFVSRGKDFGHRPPRHGHDGRGPLPPEIKFDNGGLDLYSSVKGLGSIIMAPGRNGAIESVGGQEVRYTHETGKINLIGLSRVSYGEDGKIDKIGSKKVIYTSSGTIDRVE